MAKKPCEHESRYPVCVFADELGGWWLHVVCDDCGWDFVIFGQEVNKDEEE